MRVSQALWDAAEPIVVKRETITRRVNESWPRYVPVTGTLKDQRDELIDGDDKTFIITLTNERATYRVIDVDESSDVYLCEFVSVVDV